MVRLFSAALLIAVSFQCHAGDFTTGTEDDPFLGINTIFLAKEDAKEYFRKNGMPPPPKGGLVVTHSFRKGPGEALAPLDIIWKVGPKPIRTLSEAQDVLKALRVGKPCKLAFLRPTLLPKGVRWPEKDVEVTPVTKRDYALGGLISERDDLLEVTYVGHCEAPKNETQESGLVLYQARGDDNTTSTFLRVHRAGTESLFTSSLSIKTDGQLFRFTSLDLPTVHRGIKFRDDGSSIQWEYVDLRVDSSNAEMIESIAKSGETTVRFESGSSKLDVEIPSIQIDRIGLVQMAIRNTP
ncbi:hypothetical protein SH661x_001916 [Planctomicrobium sp. SH661]|uniref:hypothetical protein n=1 Tax=Planctomicrobium sp. SH661 TaxID=3448124 RepID=UPI003F5C2136